MDDREARREERHAEREAERETRRAERESRRAERQARRAEWRAEHAGFGSFLGHALGDKIRAELRQSIGPDLGRRIRDELREGMVTFDAGGSGQVVADEVVERTFTVTGTPRVVVRNVAGDNDIAVGEPGQVYVRARKRMRGWSEDRAKRLLDNVEIRLEQNGDEILVEPRLFEQERGWLELFRGGRVAVDLDIRVPREAHLDVTTVSGELAVGGTRGQIELRSVSGDVSVRDAQGPMRVRSVSGDVDVRDYAGQVEANSVSGDVRFERSRVRPREIVTVSGDVDIDAVATGSDEGRVRTVSGDVELSFADGDVEVDYHTMSGDAEADVPAAQVHKEGRHDRRIVIGRGTGHLRVKTISGDLCCRATDEATVAPSSPAADEAIPMREPAAPPPAPPSPAAREVLEKLARGELSVDDAAAALDAARSPEKREG